MKQLEELQVASRKQESDTPMAEAYEDLFSQSSGLERIRNGRWEKQCLGEAKIQKHKESGTLRFVFCQEKAGA